jgi:diguanylate cyclase
VPLFGASFRHANPLRPAPAVAAGAGRGWRVLYPRAGQVRAARVSDWFARLTWLGLAISGFALLSVPVAQGAGRQVAESANLGTVVGLFVLFLIRLISAATAWRERRPATIALALSIVLWAIGSSILASTDQPDLLSFPAPGEGFYLGSYALMAIFLLLDIVNRGRGRVSLTTAVEAVVTVGGAICVAGAVLLTPVSAQLDGRGVGALLALLYPLLDLLLAAVVLADLVLQRRSWSRQSLALLGGFMLLAAADSTFVWKLAGGAYDFGPVLDLCWATALALLVSGACGPRQQVAREGDSRTVVPPFVAALVAVVVLVFTPTNVENLYLVVPAVLTLLGAGARLALALREAHGAAEAYRLSLTDDLTGLPNRRALLARVQAESTLDTPMALLLLDLDGFKDVNDTLGHVAGDHVLRLIARRLRREVNHEAMVARLGGDEFAITLQTADQASAMRAADWVRDVVAEPVEVQGHTFIMGASVGVAISSSADTRADLLRRADIAMYQAKTTRAGSLMYDPDRDEFTTERLKTAEYLRVGVPGGQLRAWYQPQVDATSHELTGLEALVRWEHPELGILAPAAFLNIARQTGLMPLLTETVVELVLNDATKWLRLGISAQVSFNIAPPELLNVSLLERLLARIDAAKLPPDTLILEVTEDSLLADPERARRALHEIRQHDVQVSIDDYGTGFSSLSYLRDLPVHELKLDRSFISAVRTDPRSRIIVASTNQMAQGLGLRTVAEGVEDAQIAETVGELGINVLQGYHIARPMPADEVPAWAAQWRAKLAADAEVAS